MHYGSTVGDHSRLPRYDFESTHKFDTRYSGKRYAVQYLGIVDGTMGVLSRTMALQAEATQPTV